MADAVNILRIRSCEACGAEYSINPRYSAAQIARSRFCSRKCSNVSRPERQPMPIEQYLKGNTRFGMFTFVSEGEAIVGKYHPIRRAKVRCDCGNIRHVQPAHLLNGKHNSCGCTNGEISRQRFTTHGASGTPEYSSWKAMIDRCHNPKSTNFQRYGARGINVCQQWHGADGFAQFVKDMGPRPIGTTLDRIRGNEGYSPDNCRWATRKQQQTNLSSNVMLTYDGKTMTQKDWAIHLGMSGNAISERIRKGCSVEEALTAPPRGKPSRP